MISPEEKALARIRYNVFRWWKLVWRVPMRAEPTPVYWLRKRIGSDTW
jgi:hypothetical protein